MKKVVYSFILGMLLVLQAIHAVSAMDEITVVNPTSGLAVRKPAKPMELLSAAQATELNQKMSVYNAKPEQLLINNSVSYYYYDNIDPIAREIYDVLYGVAQDPVNEGNIGLMMTDMDPQSDEYYYEFNLAYRALCFDHPELFWLYSGTDAMISFCSEAVVQNGFYFVYMMMDSPYKDFKKVMECFNKASKNILKEVDMNASEYEIVRQVHDKLLGLVNYNDPVASGEIVQFQGQDLAHTAYGCLVADSSGNKNYAVCDGYALAFEYLLQQCGINAVFIAGWGGSDETNLVGHAWNVVELDGEWYEVDTTWDDAESILDDYVYGTENYALVKEALEDVQYRDALEKAYFLISTERIRNFVAGDEYRYRTKDGQVSFSLINDSVHIRYQTDQRTLGDPDLEIISLAPLSLQNYREG